MGGARRNRLTASRIAPSLRRRSRRAQRATKCGASRQRGDVTRRARSSFRGAVTRRGSASEPAALGLRILGLSDPSIATPPLSDRRAGTAGVTPVLEGRRGQLPPARVSIDPLCAATRSRPHPGGHVAIKHASAALPYIVVCRDEPRCGSSSRSCASTAPPGAVWLVTNGPTRCALNPSDARSCRSTCAADPCSDRPANRTPRSRPARRASRSGHSVRTLHARTLSRSAEHSPSAAGSDATRAG